MVYRNERQQIKSSALEAARKANKKLTFVPLVLLFLRFWGMLRFYVYLTSSVDESESTRKFKKSSFISRYLINFLLRYVFVDGFFALTCLVSLINNPASSPPYSPSDRSLLYLQQRAFLIK